MASLHRIALPYLRDSCVIFSSLKHLPLPIFLDSANAYSEGGHFDIICAQPIDVITWHACDDKSLHHFLSEAEQRLKSVITEYLDCDQLPFSGGAVGYIDYNFGELASNIRPSPRLEAPLSTPNFHVGIYPWAIVVDHHRKQCELVAQPSVSEKVLTHIKQLVLNSPQQSLKNTARFQLTSSFTSTLDRKYYEQAFNQVQDYIQAGDCYQVNLTRAFNASYQGDTWPAYQKLRDIAAAPFSAYIDLGSSQVLSFSPERLLSANNGKLQTQPIKGTAARSADPDTDKALALALQRSAKNRAENIMIVDLLRNDFSKSCKAASVRTDQLCELQTFRTVHHLVSTVSGELREECSSFQALLSCFPGGSITGAPKHRAMEIISEIEPHQRKVYCGSIFYLGGNGKMDSNIAIRSFLCDGEQITGWAGGGIVADSDVDEEFIETETKIGKLIQALADFN
ncbi:Aminodeoxychorismate synthase component 1 [Zhongshania aliphaticivorans]|uniref:aminodeoxychorismate synthase n=1 Tax=Zhongshania aliphaticivorans TaxID=1470434 RepID=A0A5S9NWE0_9GAMM|nr:aminodeoxychorismate synthase component I [Zhongshania aliphaticivorans]CAA0088677.1 Aminodeoxychorismate synthase component 1 [Zhongshania aliphaticivorans]CAA0094902.1 Aminodeoxychorismate synthase component 1 [Zhongshania aliphaticivorans]